MVGRRPVTPPTVIPEVERLELRLDAMPDSVGRARKAVVAFAGRHGLAAAPTSRSRLPRR